MQTDAMSARQGERPRHNAAFMRQSMTPAFDHLRAVASSRPPKPLRAAIPSTPPGAVPEKATEKPEQFRQSATTPNGTDE